MKHLSKALHIYYEGAQFVSSCLCLSFFIPFSKRYSFYGLVIRSIPSVHSMWSFQIKSACLWSVFVCIERNTQGEGDTPFKAFTLYDGDTRKSKANEWKHKRSFRWIRFTELARPMYKYNRPCAIDKLAWLLLVQCFGISKPASLRRDLVNYVYTLLYALHEYVWTSKSSIRKSQEI